MPPPYNSSPLRSQKGRFIRHYSCFSLVFSCILPFSACHRSMLPFAPILVVYSAPPPFSFPLSVLAVSPFTISFCVLLFIFFPASSSFCCLVSFHLISFAPFSSRILPPLLFHPTPSIPFFLSFSSSDNLLYSCLSLSPPTSSSYVALTFFLGNILFS